jgi:hypothetical protein
MDLERVPTIVANCFFPWEQTTILPFDDRIALACLGFQQRAIAYGDVAAAVMDQSCPLQPSGGLRDALAAYAQANGNQLLRQWQIVRCRPVQA